MHSTLLRFAILIFRDAATIITWQEDIPQRKMQIQKEIMEKDLSIE